MAADIRRSLDLIEGFLQEAPVSNFRLHGDFSTADSFGHPKYPVSAPDHKIVSNAKAVEKFKRAFSRSHFNFAFHLINTQAFPKDDDDKSWNYDDYITGYIPDNLTDVDAIKAQFGHDIQIDPAAINIVMLGNNLDAGMATRNDQISGWILAHRVGHATSKVNDGELRVETAYGSMPYNVAKIMGFEAPSIYGKGMPDASKAMEAIWMMKSARESRLADPAAELIAQFIIQGRVRFNRLDNDEADRLIEAAEERVNREIHTVLHELVGKLLVL